MLADTHGMVSDVTGEEESTHLASDSLPQRRYSAESSAEPAGEAESGPAVQARSTVQWRPSPQKASLGAGSLPATNPALLKRRRAMRVEHAVPHVRPSRLLQRVVIERDMT